MKKTIIKVIISTIFIILSIVLLSFFKNSEQILIEKETVKTIEAWKDPRVVPLYFKKIKWQSNEFLDEHDNYKSLIDELNKKYHGTLNSEQRIELNVVYIYETKIKSFKQIKKLKKIRYEITNIYNC